MTIYRSKPSLIEAVQWTGENLDECRRFGNFMGRVKVRLLTPESDLRVLTGAEGTRRWAEIPVGHWLVSQPGDRSDIWPVDPDTFAAKYEERKP